MSAADTAMSTANDVLPILDVAGDGRARGLAYGAHYGERVRRTWRYYAETVFATSKLSSAEIERRTAKVRELIGAFSPDLRDEIDAIAEGAGLPRWTMHALNARTEILNARVGECTALYVPATRTLGQTWDWLAPLEDLIVLTRCTYPDGHRLLTMAEPGQLAKVGMNSAGLGVCLNFLVAPHGLEGVPVHVLLRALLECTSLAAARRLLDAAGLGKSSHFLLADDQGQALSFEFAGTRKGEVPAVEGGYVHTNHCIAPDRDPDGYEIDTSPERLAAARALLADAPRADVDGVKRLLDFNDGGKASIRVTYRPEPMMGGGLIGSCATVVMDLPGRSMHVRKGPDPARAFARHAV